MIISTILEHINSRLHKRRIENLKNVDKINEYKAKKALEKQKKESEDV